MGCDFSHGDLRMSYREFRYLIESLADEAGISLQKLNSQDRTASDNEIEEPLLSMLMAFDEYGGGEVDSRKCLALSRRIWEIADRWASPQHAYHIRRPSAAALAHAVGEAAFLGEQFYWF